MGKIRRVEYLPVYIIAVMHFMISIGVLIRPSASLGVIGHLQSRWAYDTDAYQIAAVFFVTGILFALHAINPSSKAWLLFPLIFYTIVAYSFFRESVDVSGMAFMWSAIVLFASTALLSLQYAFHRLKYNGSAGTY